MTPVVLAVAIATATPTWVPFGTEWKGWHEKTYIPWVKTVDAEFAKAKITPTVIPTRNEYLKTYVWMERGLFVDLKEFRLYVVRGGDAMAAFPVAVGFKNTKMQSITPIGTFKVTEKHRYTEEGSRYGTRYLKLNAKLPTGKRFILIHGTNQPELIGFAVSDGCVRLRNEDIERLYEAVQVGDPVQVVR